MAMAGQRKRLREEDSPAEQFATLRQVKSLSLQECRNIVSLLQIDERGKRTCSRMRQKYTEALPCLREIAVPMGSGLTLKQPCMSLPALVQAKVQACPFYAQNLTAAYHTSKGLAPDPLCGRGSRGERFGGNACQKSNACVCGFC